MSAPSPLKVGGAPPQLALEDQSGALYDLTKHKGKGVIVFFYAKDRTPGCTLEVRDFTQLAAEFEANGFQVVGVSPDSIESHRVFSAELGSNLALLSDPTHTTMANWGAWGDKINYGRHYVGVIRSTVIVNSAGLIAKIYPNVRATGHANRVLRDVVEIESQVTRE